MDSEIIGSVISAFAVIIGAFITGRVAIIVKEKELDAQQYKTGKMVTQSEKDAARWLWGLLGAIVGILVTSSVLWLVGFPKSIEQSSTEKMTVPSNNFQEQEYDQSSFLITRKESVPAPTTRHFDVFLENGEIIVGQSHEVIVHKTEEPQLYRECVALLIRGPGQFEFSILDGWWVQYANTTFEDAQSLLQGQIDSLIVNGCPVAPKVVEWSSNSLSSPEVISPQNTPIAVQLKSDFSWVREEVNIQSGYNVVWQECPGESPDRCAWWNAYQHGDPTVLI